MSATGSRDQGGFTLIESLTVLAITAAIGALIFPQMNRAVRAVALVEARQAVMADLRWARGRAMASDAPMRLLVAQDGGAYGWEAGPQHPLPGGVRLRQDGPAPIAFYPDGSARPGGLNLWSGPRRARVQVSANGVVAVTEADAPVAVRP